MAEDRDASSERSRTELSAASQDTSQVQGDEKPKSKHGNTLFVTRLPYTVTNTDLSTFFSDIGPLRRAFVVSDRESRKSKGIGYVTYVDAEDAERAHEKLQGSSIDGSRRHIQLEWADRRSTTAEGREGKREKSTAGRVAPSHTLPERDPDAVRTIVVSGLESCSPPADTKTLYKRVRKIGDVEHVEFKELDGTPSKDVALVRFRTPNHAMDAVSKLHAHQFKGAQLSVGLKKRLEGALRLEQHMRPDTLKKHQSMKQKIEELNGQAWNVNQNRAGLSRESRVIIRNLPFDITLEDLRAIFLPYGPIYDITVPTKQSEGEESKPPRGRGFAFVWFVSRADAARAIEAVNGVSLRHGAAEQAALKKAKGKKGREVAKEALDKVQASAQPARPVAVDWSLSQKDWLARAEEEPTEEPESTQTPTKRPRSEGDDEDVSQEENSSSDSGDSDSDSDSDSESSDANTEPESDDEDEQADESSKPPNKLATTDTGTILFIRNLPYQATEQELKDLFRSFGPMRYAKITMDPATKRSRGTGFVCFWKRESADAALHDAELVQRETAASSLMDAKLPKSNPFSVPSVMTADPSAPLVARFTLHGRVLNVSRAVTREHAAKLETASRKSREKSDNRNTWLLREGVPLPNTPLSKSLSEKEVDRRLQSFSIRRAQLGANPSLHVSKTRLAVHQLPLFVTDKMLKRMALYALRAFTDEVKAGEREDLDEDEKADKTVSANVKETTDSESGKKRPPPSLVIQSKVVRQNERVDPFTGKGRSRGYGFVEMRTFPHALKVLRWANGNKALGDLFTTWWKEDLTANIAKIKGEKAPSDDQRLYLKRLESALQDLEEGHKAIKSEVRGTLRIEFSIENVTTVRKRVLRQTQAREKQVKRQKVCLYFGR